MVEKIQFFPFLSKQKELNIEISPSDTKLITRLSVSYVS